MELQLIRVMPEHMSRSDYQVCGSYLLVFHLGHVIWMSHGCMSVSYRQLQAASNLVLHWLCPYRVVSCEGMLDRQQAGTLRSSTDHGHHCNAYMQVMNEHCRVASLEAV